jgi:hypothetical protein
MTLVKPVKILCLHGYMQNAQILRRKTGALRKKLQNIAELGKCNICVCMCDDDSSSMSSLCDRTT